MDKLDRAVAEHLEWRILDPQRLTIMMDQLLERREEWTERRRGHITELRKRQAEAEAKLKRLYEAIENGLVNMADPSLKDRIAELTATRDQSQADAERATAAVDRLGPEITPESLKRFALAARRKIKNEDGTYRRDHLRALAQRVEVVSKSEIRLMGSKTELLRTLAAAASVESAAAGVRSFIPKWRARKDSNL
jgi:site-specific DNA recombinase